jgi:hypothetical protein
MGLTWFHGTETYPGTIARISEDVAWNGVAVELGVRRCFTTPVLAPEHYRNLRPARPSTGSGRTGFGERSPPRDE